MIGHILKKDLGLLWPLVLILLVLHGVEAVLVYRLGPFLEPRSLLPLAYLLPLVSILGMAALTAVAVHQDPLPDGSQDWLVRPIRRRDLLLAKLLFVVVFVHGPLWLADTLLGVAAGFAPLAAAGAAAARASLLLCLITLPALCIAAVTSNLVQALIVSLGLLMAFLATWAILMMLGERPPLGGASLLWLLLGAWEALGLLAAVTLLGLQYFGRRTFTARRAGLVFAPLAILAPLLFAWHPGFRLQSALAAEHSAAADSIVLAMDASQPRFHEQEMGPLQQVLQQRTGYHVVYLPLRITGLGQDLLVSDRTELRLLDDAAGGAEIYRGYPNLSVDGVGSLDSTRLWAPGRGKGPVYQALYLPPAIYHRIKDRAVRVELYYYLTLLRPAAPVGLPALNADQALAGFGRCASRIDDDGDGVQLGCLTLDPRSASCFSAYLEQPATGVRNPRLAFCEPDYSPQPDNLWPTALSNAHLELPFRDLNGLAHYPVDASAVSTARVVAQAWLPRAHFERTLVISGVRLADWEPQP